MLTRKKTILSPTKTLYSSLTCPECEKEALTWVFPQQLSYPIGHTLVPLVDELVMEILVDTLGRVYLVRWHRLSIHYIRHLQIIVIIIMIITTTTIFITMMMMMMMTMMLILLLLLLLLQLVIIITAIVMIVVMMMTIATTIFYL